MPPNININLKRRRRKGGRQGGERTVNKRPREYDGEVPAREDKVGDVEGVGAADVDGERPAEGERAEEVQRRQREAAPLRLVPPRPPTPRMCICRDRDGGDAVTRNARVQQGEEVCGGDEGDEGGHEVPYLLWVEVREEDARDAVWVGFLGADDRERRGVHGWGG